MAPHRIRRASYMRRTGRSGSHELPEVPLEELRDLVDGLVGLVQRAEVELEHVRAFRGNLQRHVDVVPAGVRGKPRSRAASSVATASPPPAESPATRRPG